MSKKMTKDIKYVVEQANEILKNPKSSIEFKTDVFAFIQHLLLDKKMYHGFNYYIYDSFILFIINHIKSKFNIITYISIVC